MEWEEESVGGARPRSPTISWRSWRRSGNGSGEWCTTASLKEGGRGREEVNEGEGEREEVNEEGRLYM